MHDKMELITVSVWSWPSFADSWHTWHEESRLSFLMLCLDFWGSVAFTQCHVESNRNWCWVFGIHGDHPIVKGGILCQHCVSRPCKCLQFGWSESSASRFHVLDQSHANVAFSCISSSQLSLTFIVMRPWQPVTVIGFLFVGKSNAKISRSLNLLSILLCF